MLDRDEALMTMKKAINFNEPAGFSLVLGGPLFQLWRNRIFYLGAALPDFKIEIAVIVVFLFCLVLARG